MDLPDDIMKHIQSYLTIVSWRAEHHFLKLLQRYKNFTFEDIPFYWSYWRYTDQMKHNYLYEYTKPLREYLNEYRQRIIFNAWSLKSSFTLFDIQVNGVIRHAEYTQLLYSRANVEGAYNEFYTWQGCLPLEDYKKACTIYRISTIY